MMKNPFFGKHMKDAIFKAGIGLVLVATFAAATSCGSTHSCSGTQKESNRYQMRR